MEIYNDASVDSVPNRTIIGRSLDRIINFSDAVVAVAITVLVMPIVAIDGPTSTHSMLDVLSENSGQLIAFGLTFLIVFILWQGHHRVFENFVAIGNTIMWINALFLHLIYRHGRRHPDFLVNGDLWSSWMSISFVFALVLVVMVIASILIPAIAVWFMFLLIPLRFFIQKKDKLPGSTTR